jgi:hypothetical protein
MKTSFVLLSLLLLLLSSCLNDFNNDDNHEIVTDRDNFRDLQRWVETESKTGDSDWQAISPPKNLFLYYDSLDVDGFPFSNYIDGLPYHWGAIIYKPILNTSINTDTEKQARFKRDESIFTVFLNAFTPQADTILVNYNIPDKTTFVITDSTVTPPISIKFKLVE